MKTYRLDRRFVLRATGINVVCAGVAALIAFLLAASDAPEGLRVVVTLVTVVLVANALVLALLPPVVVRSGSSGIRVGGRLTVRPVQVAWLEIENVSIADRRIFLERGGSPTLVVPLSYVGRRADEIVREIYDRLNDANGYRRFFPSASAD